MPNAFAERLLDEADGHRNARNYASAARLIDQALAIEPKNLRALSYGADVAMTAGKKDLALNLIKQSLKLAPRAPTVIHDAALVFWKCGQRQRARQFWEQLNELQPRSVEVLWNLAVYHYTQDDAEAAERYLRKVMELAPRHPGLHTNLGNALRGSGRIEEAIALYREGARLFPQAILESSNYLYSLQFDPSYGPEQIYAEHAGWGRAMEAAIPAANGHVNDRSPDRRLRIGYVAPYFRGHVAGHLFMPLLRQHDHSQFEIYCYSDTREPDEMTAVFRRGADVWRDTSGLSDAELAAQISQDRIDVLVDLVMHMEGVRLGMFARKPAPIQVTWMAYPGTTGLTRMDYRLTDPVLDPPGETDRFYTEQSIRLETFWCFEPPANGPDIGPLPADKNGYITFGCLNNFSKVNDGVLEVWREILAAVPDSHLILKPPKGKIAERVREKLGVDSARLIGLPLESRLKYFKFYHRIDLALDPFPVPGHTTTLDGLWMGVPLVTLAGPTVTSRGSLSILCNVGLTELAAKNKADYVALAVELARDKARLRELRAGLRGRLERSVLMDASRFARQMESAYRAMWKKWCESPAIEPKNLRAPSYDANAVLTADTKDLTLPQIEEALTLAPDEPKLMQDAALVYWKCGRPHRARELWERLDELQPRSLQTLWNLAIYHYDVGDAETAEMYFRKVMELAPHHPGLHMCLGNMVKFSGRIEEAIALYREGAGLFPMDMRQSSGYLYALQFDPSYGPKQIHAEHVAWGRALEASTPAASAHANDCSPERRLRIGYVSPDFRDHPVGRSFLPLFRQHDRSQFEIYCYSHTPHPDAMTAQFRQGADVWRDTGNVYDGHLAAQVQQDRIDVLVDLVMHTNGVRLGLFARKPAPIQVTWLAYPGTTGLTRMDYRFTDPFLDPPGETDHFYTEQSIRLETFWCYEPPANSPETGPLPADKNGYVTFGCLNNFGKVNDEVLELWREILAAVPDSRLVLVPPKGKITDRVRERLGVAPARLIGLPRESHLQYLNYYHRIDLALDPFPCTGGITTLDGIWMGVPLVTLSGPTVSSRGSLSILSNLGLRELVVTNRADYVALAVALAQNKERLRELRAGLRERLERSVLMDASRFARQIESAYRTIWRKWCEKVPAG